MGVFLSDRTPHPLTPAQAGVQSYRLVALGPRFRGDERREALPGRGAARADQCRRVAERAGLFEPLGEVLDARFVRALTGGRGARPLNRGNGLGGRSFRFLLGFAPERRVAD